MLWRLFYRYNFFFFHISFCLPAELHIFIIVTPLLTVYLSWVWVENAFLDKPLTPRQNLCCVNIQKFPRRRACCRTLISQVGWVHNLWMLKLSAHYNHTGTHPCVHTWASTLTPHGKYGGSKPFQRLECVLARQNRYLNNVTFSFLINPYTKMNIAHLNKSFFLLL